MDFKVVNQDGDPLAQANVFPSDAWGTQVNDPWPGTASDKDGFFTVPRHVKYFTVKYVGYHKYVYKMPDNPMNLPDDFVPETFAPVPPTIITMWQESQELPEFEVQAKKGISLLLLAAVGFLIYEATK